MMIAAIISFAIEIVFLIISMAMIASDTLTAIFAIFIIVVFALCTIASIIFIPLNAIKIKDRSISKGISITGLAFSAAGAFIGSIFCMTVIVTLATHL